MKTVTVSTRAKTLNDLLRQARRNGLILQSPEGERFVLTPIGNWLGFEVGNSDDLAEEANLTTQNQPLMEHLAARRSSSQRISLDKVRAQLGLDTPS